MWKILRKSQPNIYHYVEKIGTQAKKWFSNKKMCICKIEGGCANSEISGKCEVINVTNKATYLRL